jgi:hypothetical protein
MTTSGETHPTEYAVGVSDRPCEITDEMRAVMKANSQALADMMADTVSTKIIAGEYVIGPAVATGHLAASSEAGVSSPQAAQG